jgi:TAT (twin-arginine translocation) pathway signal sequence
MQRRSFLKGMLGTAAATTLPNVSVAATVKQFSPDRKEFFVGNLPSTEAGVMCQDVTVTASQMQQDLGIFVMKFDEDQHDVTIRIPPRLRFVTDIAFTTESLTHVDDAMIRIPMRVRAVEILPAEDRGKDATEYVMSGRRVLARVVPWGPG